MKLGRSLSLATLALAAQPAAAMEFGIIRPLQNGPVGDSPQYAELGQYDGEAGVVATRSWGKYTLNGDADSKVSATSFKTRVATGGGWQPSKSFALTGYIDFTLASDYDEEQKRASPSATLDAGEYRHEFSVFGTYKGGGLVMGGGLGMLLVGTETREFKYDDDDYTQDVGSAAMPVLRVFGGYMSKSLDVTGGFRLFSMGEAVVKADADHEKEEYDIVRRNPGEVHADGRIKFASAQIAASLAYVLSAQSSEMEDEFSTRFSGTGSKKERRTGGERRDGNQFKVGLGGRFDPMKTFGILGGLSYIGSAYAKPELASLEHENLGGVRLDLGTDVKIQMFRGYFMAGYMMDTSHSFTQKDSDRGKTQVDQSQRPVIEEGDKVKMSQGMWQIALGGGVSL